MRNGGSGLVHEVQVGCVEVGTVCLDGAWSEQVCLYGIGKSASSSSSPTLARNVLERTRQYPPSPALREPILLDPPPLPDGSVSSIIDPLRVFQVL